MDQEKFDRSFTDVSSLPEPLHTHVQKANKMSLYLSKRNHENPNLRSRPRKAREHLLGIYRDVGLVPALLCVLSCTPTKILGFDTAFVQKLQQWWRTKDNFELQSGWEVVKDKVVEMIAPPEIHQTSVTRSGPLTASDFTSRIHPDPGYDASSRASPHVSPGSWTAAPAGLPDSRSLSDYIQEMLRLNDQNTADIQALIKTMENVVQT